MNKLMLLWLSVLFGCTTQPDSILYKATCGEETLMFRAIDPGALQDHRLYTELTIGNRPPIRPQHSLTYDMAIYGQSPWKLIDTTLSYSQHRRFEYPRRRLMLYLDPKIYSKGEFEIIARCLSTHAGAMVRAMDTGTLWEDYQFAGIVLGNSGDFVQRFSDGKAYVDIYPDGNILYERNESQPPGDSTVFYNFLGNKVQMPGRRIIIQDPVPVVEADWHKFRNRAGQPFDSVFAIEYESDQSRPNQP